MSCQTAAPPRARQTAHLRWTALGCAGYAAGLRGQHGHQPCPAPVPCRAPQPRQHQALGNPLREPQTLFKCTSHLSATTTTNKTPVCSKHAVQTQADPLPRGKAMVSMASQSQHPSRATAEIQGAEPRGSSPWGPRARPARLRWWREPADLSDVLSTWAWVFISLSVYTRLTIYTCLGFVTRLVFRLPYVIFSALFYFCFLGWRHHKILTTLWKHQPSHFPQLHVQEQREFLVRGAASATYHTVKIH